MSQTFAEFKANLDEEKKALLDDTDQETLESITKEELEIYFPFLSLRERIQLGKFCREKKKSRSRSPAESDDEGSKKPDHSVGHINAGLAADNMRIMSLHPSRWKSMESLFLMLDSWVGAKGFLTSEVTFIKQLLSTQGNFEEWRKRGNENGLQIAKRLLKIRFQILSPHSGGNFDDVFDQELAKSESLVEVEDFFKVSMKTWRELQKVPRPTTLPFQQATTQQGNSRQQGNFRGGFGFRRK